MKLERWMLRNALGLAILAAVNLVSYCARLPFENRGPR